MDRKALIEILELQRRLMDDAIVVLESLEALVTSAEALTATKAVHALTGKKT